MDKYIMVAQSQAKPGRDEEYNHWYDNFHFKEVSAIPGIKSGQRFDAMPASMGEPGLQYLAIFELETNDPATILDELKNRFASGQMTPTDSLDVDSSKIWLYKPR